jgi:hypothetical protein
VGVEVAVGVGSGRSKITAPVISGEHS